MNRSYFRLALIFIFLASCAPAAAAQKLVRGGKPSAARIPGYADAKCAAAGSIARVCKAIDEGDEDGNSVFLIERERKTVGTIEAARNMAATTANFHVFSGDLDKNGAAELVVVDFENQSLGMGVSYYRVNIFPDFETRGFQTPLSFPTVEFGAEGSFVFDAEANETQMLLAEWHGYDHLDAPRPGGLYFVGRYFRFRNGKIQPVAGKPVLARRYLSSFERERTRTALNPRAPLAWFASPQTKKLSVDPELGLKPSASENGRIEKFELVSERAANADGEAEEVRISQIVVRTDSGRTLTFVLDKSDPDVELPGAENRIRPQTFGALGAKIALPADVPPTAVFDRFEGRRVRIDAFKSAFEGATDAERTYNLWIAEN